jgi:hypothetical protein
VLPHVPQGSQSGRVRVRLKLGQLQPHDGQPVRHTGRRTGSFLHGRSNPGANGSTGAWASTVALWTGSCGRRAAAFSGGVALCTMLCQLSSMCLLQVLPKAAGVCAIHTSHRQQAAGEAWTSQHSCVQGAGTDTCHTHRSARTDCSGSNLKASVRH